MTEQEKGKFKAFLEKFSVKKVNADMEELDKRQSFIEQDSNEAGYTPSGKVIREGTYSGNKRLKKKANSIRGINLINLPFFLKRDCGVKLSFLNILLNYIVAFLIIFGVGYIHRLKLIPIIIMCVIYFIFGPSLIYYKHRKKHEKELFEVCTRYIENMLYSFMRKSKILTALQETRLVVTGDVGRAIDFAINKIQNGRNDEGNTYEVALKEIEAILPCSRVKNLHEFLAEVENVGGKHSTAIDIMLDDVREWDVRVNRFQQDQNVRGISLIISILMSLGTCLFMTRVLPADMGGDISGYLLYQVLTTISIIVMFFIYRVASRKLTRSWVTDSVESDPRALKRDLAKVAEYEKKQSGMKPYLAIERIKTELEKQFPRWVMRFSLLASTHPIPTALRLSLESCPLVIKAELRKLIADIDENPTGIEPYINFFANYKMPQIRSMMLMIYSLSEFGAADIDKHILSLVKRNYSLQGNAEQIENDEKLARFSLYTTIPMLLACVIMMIDVGMTVLNMINSIDLTM